MEELGIFRLAEELGFETVVFDELAAEDWTMVQPPNSHWETGFPFARPCQEADALVQKAGLATGAACAVGGVLLAGKGRRWAALGLLVAAVAAVAAALGKIR